MAFIYSLGAHEIREAIEHWMEHRYGFKGVEDIVLLDRTGNRVAPDVEVGGMEVHIRDNKSRAKPKRAK